MRGPLFNQLISTRTFSLQEGESLNDLEKMYSLIIEARGKSINTLTKFDEEVTLASLCQLSFPGKTPNYTTEARKLRSNYKGISQNLILEQKFKDKIRYSIKSAINESQINFSEIGNLFFD